MKNLHNKYPKDWFDANRLVKKLNIQFIAAEQQSDKKKKSREVLGVMKTSYTILKKLDDAIANSDDNKELNNLAKARQVLSTWMKKRRFPEKL